MALQNSIYQLPMTWKLSAGGTLAPNTGYVINSNVTFNVPTTGTMGDTYIITTSGAPGGFTINSSIANLYYNGNAFHNIHGPNGVPASIYIVCIGQIGGGNVGFTILSTVGTFTTS